MPDSDRIAELKADLTANLSRIDRAVTDLQAELKAERISNAAAHASVRGILDARGAVESTARVDARASLAEESRREATKVGAIWGTITAVLVSGIAMVIQLVMRN